MNREDPFAYLLVDLNERQKCFAREYLIDHKCAAAARRAGYSPRSAGAIASHLLRNAKIREYIGSHSQASAMAVNLTVEFVIGGLMREAVDPNSPAGARITAYTQLGKFHELSLWAADKGEDDGPGLTEEDTEILKRAKQKLIDRAKKDGEL